MNVEISPTLLLNAYANGIFPMADDDGKIFWLCPEPRTIFDLQRFHVSRTLRQIYRQRKFELSFDRDFAAVIDGCADRPEGTWISPVLRAAYLELHRLGFAHSVEAWRDGRLAAGLYGVALGGAFFGESMFHRVPNGSKVALVYLVERMRERGFVLLDTQFPTPFLEQFHCLQIARSEYLQRLDDALKLDCRLVD